VIVLGFDTATQSTAVALRSADGGTLQTRDDPAPDGHPGHATRLLGMAGELLAAAGLGWNSLERIAVGVGPGRFTGLRVGIATARGLAQSLAVEVVGISSLRALALVAAARESEARGTLAVIDARRGEAFAAGYPVATDFSREGLPGGEPLDGEIVFPRALGPADLRKIGAGLERRGGTPGRRWLAVGDGAAHFRVELQSAGVEVAEDRSPLHLVDAGAICQLGARAAAAGSYEQVLPDYRRTPDAALALERPVSLKGAGS
jgi:tRNA threonylcarbamoyladenosine biosynthesis protein TsaB